MCKEGQRGCVSDAIRSQRQPDGKCHPGRSTASDRTNRLRKSWLQAKTSAVKAGIMADRKMGTSHYGVFS